MRILHLAFFYRFNRNIFSFFELIQKFASSLCNINTYNDVANRN